LELQNNGISGAIPPEVDQLRRLPLLFIYRNSFAGNIPSEIGNLESLIDLALSSNQFLKPSGT